MVLEQADRYNRLSADGRTKRQSKKDEERTAEGVREEVGYKNSFKEALFWCQDTNQSTLTIINHSSNSQLMQLIH